MENAKVAPESLLKSLLAENPKFHSDGDNAGVRNWAIQTPVLEWMVNNLPRDARTLETGCGYTTVILASLSKHHIVISPLPEEHTLIKEWCSRHGMSTHHLTLLANISQDVVPSLECEKMDFILIDGDHAFPGPFIDWYYLADKLKVGGYLAVDDTQIRTGKILRDFLAQESARWVLASEIGKTAIFKRITGSPVAIGIQWREQPYCHISNESSLKLFLRRIKRKIGL